MKVALALACFYSESDSATQLRRVSTNAAGAAVLDAGCGNGKYLGVPGCEGVRVFGCDISLGLLDVCVGRGHDVVRANALRLPYRRAPAVNSCGQAPAHVGVTTQHEDCTHNCAPRAGPNRSTQRSP